MPYSIFLSHNVYREDYSLIVHIANLMWQEGIEVFIPEWFPRYPEAVNRRVGTQIEASDLVLAIVTSSTARSSYMYQEMGYARAKGKHIIALVEQGVNTEGFLADAPRIEFSRGQFYPAADNVVRYVHETRAQEPDQATQRTVLGLVLGGLFLWWLSRQGRSEG